MVSSDGWQQLVEASSVGLFSTSRAQLSHWIRHDGHLIDVAFDADKKKAS